MTFKVFAFFPLETAEGSLNHAHVAGHVSLPPCRFAQCYSNLKDLPTTFDLKSFSQAYSIRRRNFGDSQHGFWCNKWTASRSQRPHGLRNEMSSLARTLGSWFRIPLKACMFVCAFIFCLRFVCVGSTLRRADPPSKESYLLYIGLRNWKSGQGQTKGL
jgi:hypothetical protein